jgi:hypothetical protein
MRFFYKGSVSSFKNHDGREKKSFEVIKGKNGEIRQIRGVSNNKDPSIYHIQKKEERINDLGIIHSKQCSFKLKAANIAKLLKIESSKVMKKKSEESDVKRVMKKKDIEKKLDVKEVMKKKPIMKKDMEKKSDVKKIMKKKPTMKKDMEKKSDVKKIMKKKPLMKKDMEKKSDVKKVMKKKSIEKKSDIKKVMKKNPIMYK